MLLQEEFHPSVHCEDYSRIHNTNFENDMLMHHTCIQSRRKRSDCVGDGRGSCPLQIFQN